MSGSGTISPNARIWSQRFSPIILLHFGSGKPKLNALQQLADHVWLCGREEVDLSQALELLASEFGVRRLIGEGGGELNDALFRGGLVDELRLTVCPFLFGGRAAPSIADGLGFPNLRKAARFRLHSCRQWGDELYLVYRRPEGVNAGTLPPAA